MLRKNTSRLLIASSLSFAAMLTAQDVADRGAPPQRLTPELLWQMRSVSDPQMHPDGSTLLYHVRSYRLADNAGTTQIWLLDVATGESRQLTTQGSNSNGRFSPDGSEIGFLSTRGGDGPQIHRITLAGGEARPITRVPGGVANLSWSPSGDHFAFTAAVRLDPSMAERHPDLPKAEAKVYDDLMVRHWDEWKDGTYSHLFVVPSDGSDEPRDLMGGMKIDTPLRPFGGGEQITWAPDGRSLVYVAKIVDTPEVSTDSNLYRVAVDAEPGAEHENLTLGMPGYEVNPRFSPDGRWLAFESMARDGYEADRNRLMVLDEVSGERREVTADFDLTVAEYSWLSGGDGFAFCADQRGTRQIFTVGLEAGARPIALTEGRWHFGGLAVAPDGTALFALRQQTERPNELVRISLLDAKRGGGETVTDVNGALMRGLALPKVEQREFAASDGASIHAWVILPPDFDPSIEYPMLTYCQGGPQSQVGQWFSTRWNFHLMAANGYIVLAVNRRGLPGFGTAWNEQISRDWGGQAMRDLLAATDAMQAEPYVDARRTAAVGASFGGYTVFWLMGNDTQNRFCTMVAHCGVFNLESMYLSTEELFFVNWDLGGPFWRDTAIARDYERFSPHRFVQNWKTPLLVIHGQQDFRVPVEQGLQAFTAAQIEGVPSRFLYFPSESHWVMSPQNGVLWQREFFRWLDEYCKPAPRETRDGGGENREGTNGDTRGGEESPRRKVIQADPSTSPRDGAVATRSTAADVARLPLIEQVDDTAIAQLYADGFEQLGLRDKILCYHLANAAIAGRDIFIDQKFAHSLAIRDVLEPIYLRKDVLTPDVRAELARYLKLFWVHNGIHHAISSQKMLLRLSRAQWDGMILDAKRAGVRFDDEGGLPGLFAILTEPALFPQATDKNPADGGDPVRASANNLYVGVSKAEADAFDERHPLNSRLVRGADGKLHEEVYRAGDPARGIPPGRYAAQLSEVIGHLEQAITVAPDETATALRALVRYYQSGDPTDWREFNIAWVQDTASVVDVICGFVEVYLDVRGQKGAWESIVSFLDQQKTVAIERLAAQAQWFEDRMPWDDEFKKPDVKGITARAISVVTQTGDSGPVTPIGINLPNEADIRENYGSKSVNLANVVAAYDAITGGASLREFAWSEQEIARAERYAQQAGDVHTNLHEVIGHASGRLREHVKNPASILGLYYSTLEEARADLVALYWIADPRLRELGIVPHADCALAEYESYARNALVQLRRVPKGGKLEDDHMRNRQLIVLWLVAHGDGAIEVRRRDERTFYVVADAAKFRAGCAALLAEIMRIKATGDFKAGKQLVDTYGTRVDPTLHTEVQARIDGLGLASVTGFVQPELAAVRDRAGRILDVQIYYPRDIADQMLRWSGQLRRP